MARTKQVARRRREVTDANVSFRMKVPASQVDAEVPASQVTKPPDAEFLADMAIVRRIVRKMMRAGQTARLVKLSHDITTAAVHAAKRSHTKQ
jgi:hypothetical protein